NQYLCASQWSLANGVSSSSRDPTIHEKATALALLTSNTPVAPCDDRRKIRETEHHIDRSQQAN
ncbi:MAG: hypothetical protein WA728_11220, partial [Xanthobacteraceae bacterium]